jgi:type 1 glutamine amidotransferase
MDAGKDDRLLFTPVQTRMNRLLSLGAAFLFAAVFSGSAAEKRIVLVAGRPSHGPGEHEYNAGTLLLKKCLDRLPGIRAVVYTNGWPANPNAFDGADAIVLYMDGGADYPILREHRLQQIGGLMQRGVGLACLHYAVEPTLRDGEKEFLDWLGGAYELNWTVNPVWPADFHSLPVHPITRGVRPFAIKDEWYFNIRFRPNLEGVTPILSAVPPASTMDRPDGPDSGNPAARAAVKRGDSQILAWAFERPDGGRGFGFTGAHYHANWADDNFRKIVLNGILWAAKAEIPKNGVESKVSPKDLAENLDPKGPPLP